MERNMTTEQRNPGRPAPLGRKKTACVRLTPDVDEYLRSTGGLSQVDAIVRGTKQFKQWVAENRTQCPKST